VFTIELIESSPGDRQGFVDLEQLAAMRGSLFVPVRLICDVEELCRRVVEPARTQMIKSISTADARRKCASEAVLNTNHPHTLTLDVTKKSPGESAESIMNHLAQISRQVTTE